MSMTIINPSTAACETPRAETYFQQDCQALYRRTDRLFAGLLLFEWLACVGLALWLSPTTWSGSHSTVHIHVWVAFFLGGAMISLPVALAWLRPGRTVTRHTIGVAQMLVSGLLIHLTGGRIETHFHVFGSLAFLAFYRDWRVLVTASAVTACDHLLRGLFWPESIFGTANPGAWRWLEHVGWVVFEDIFLIYSCLLSMREMKIIAKRQADMEAINASIEQQVLERTAQLKASESRIEAIVNTASEGIITIEQSGHIEFINAAAEKLFGVSADEVIGHNINTLVTTGRDEGGGMREEMGTSILSSLILHPSSLPVVGQRKNGEMFPVELGISAFEVNGRRMYTGILRDITDRRRAEEEVVKAREAAEAANRAKSEFLANMSHEIRTPMNGILGLTELALDTTLTDEQREYLSGVKASTDTLLKVINDILDFSKIEAGKLDIEAVEFTLRDTLANTMKVLAMRAHDKGLELLCHTAVDVPDAIIGDPVRVQQILVNLVGNAVKFTEEGEIVVHVAVESRFEDDVLLHFTVRDTGIGIPLEKQQLVFQAFSQADGSTTRKYGGTGLGLTISAKLVPMMGGKIWVESQEKHGSTFHFTVRFGIQKNTQVAAVSMLPIRLADMPVLVVDDNATNRRILHDILSNWHMNPTVVDGGPNAFAALEQSLKEKTPYQLIILDCMMPDMDGFAVAAHIHKIPAYSQATIVMLTSGNQRNDPARWKALGIDAYLTKPIQKDDLLQAIIKALRISVLTKRPVSLSPLPLKTELPECKWRVLVAEDNLINQKVASRVLGKQGHQVTIAGNGKEALARLEEQAFDLVLMDVQMPEMNGFEATASIRAREQKTLRHLPIVAMTAHAMRGDRERCLEAGMDEYVSKPLQAAELIKVMDAVMTTASVLLARRADTVSMEPAFVVQDALERLDGDEDLLRDVMQIFLEDSPDRLAALRLALDQADAKKLNAVAHALKGAVGYLGAHQVVAAAARLEELAAAGNLSEAAELVRVIESEVGRLNQQLAQWIGAQARSQESGVRGHESGVRSLTSPLASCLLTPAP